MLQFLELTLHEFETLKRYLAEIRGLVAPLPADLTALLENERRRSMAEMEFKP